MGIYTEIKWYGRENGPISFSSIILAEIMAQQGKFVQVFPGFCLHPTPPFNYGYTRISGTPIKLHRIFDPPNIIVIFNYSVISLPNTSFNFKDTTNENTVFFVNTPLSPQEIKENLNTTSKKIFALDADSITLQETGTQDPSIAFSSLVFNYLENTSIDILKKIFTPFLSRFWENGQVQSRLKIIERALTEVKIFKE